jgi:hypothetical protein
MGVRRAIAGEATPVMELFLVHGGACRMNVDPEGARGANLSDIGAQELGLGATNAPSGREMKGVQGSGLGFACDLKGQRAYFRSDFDHGNRGPIRMKYVGDMIAVCGSKCSVNCPTSLNKRVPTGYQL